ncbi:MAG: outer membrane beta-barrel protein [Bryobacteraceae bacterium]
MKKFLLGTVGLLALGIAAPASAADMAARPYTKAPPPMIAAVYDWTGFYVGINGGWGSSRNNWNALTAGGAFFANEGGHDATGGTFGGQIGYRWQASQWVFGLEAQGNWADFHGRNVSLAAPLFTNESRVDAFGLFTGQVGVAFNNALLYVRGGAAVTSDRHRTFVTANNLLAANVVDDTRWGAVVGVGLEYGFAPNWSLGINYDHMFMGDRTYTVTNNGAFGAPGTRFATSRISGDVDLVTARINYRWGGPAIPKY